MASYAVGDKVEVHNAWGIDEGTVVLIGRQYVTVESRRRRTRYFFDGRSVTGNGRIWTLDEAAASRKQAQVYGELWELGLVPAGETLPFPVSHAEEVVTLLRKLKVRDEEMGRAA